MRETTDNATEAQREAREERAGGGQQGGKVAAMFCGAGGCVMAMMPRSMLLCAMPHAVVAGNDGGLCGFVIVLLWSVDDDGPGDGLDMLQLCQDGWVQMLVAAAEIEVECYGPGGYVIFCCHLA